MAVYRCGCGRFNPHDPNTFLPAEMESNTGLSGIISSTDHADQCSVVFVHHMMAEVFHNTIEAPAHSG